ncbi:MAG TPA: hypothetical protein VE912_10300, partial [Bacteroidales bacterium]|nr:hypothetical protein [Bacteroidales bacterium]
MAAKSDVFEYSLVEFVSIVFFVIVVLLLWYALFLNKEASSAQKKNDELESKNQLLSENLDTLEHKIIGLKTEVDSLRGLEEDSNKGLGKPPCDDDFSEFLFETNIVGSNKFKVDEVGMAVNLDELLFLYGDTLKWSLKNDCAFRVKAYHSTNIGVTEYIT